jgi:hypothetical protein
MFKPFLVASFTFLFILLHTFSIAQDKIPLQNVYPAPLPKTLYFAGEKVPLEDPEIRERLERELIVNCYRHSTTLIILKRVSRWREKMEKILVEQGIPKDFFYLAVIESELEPYADSGKAHGFWQFTDNTAKSLNLEISRFVDQRRDPILATIAATKHLKSTYSEFNNWTLTAAAYNLGAPTLKRVKSYQGVDSYYDLYLTSETARYLFRLLAMKLIIEDPDKYGFHLQPEDRYVPFNSVSYKVDQTIENVAKFAREKNINYKILKQYNPWIKFDSKDDYTYRFEVAPGKVYYFEMPVNVNAAKQ